ncbi:MAG: efflux RND transporter periplasmic adaptor subunit, partial [Bacteroidia bacterium]|nr:efflux RND transporter periplasmic adaptor subunit [Bacteroidia bacterium]
TTIVGVESKMTSNEGTASILVDGTIEMDQRSINSQTAHISGRLESMLINFEGDYVKAGQKIATVYSTELLAASQELITAAQFEDRVEGLKEASIQKLKNWKISDSQINQILQSGNPIETMDIFADHSGYVLSKKVSQGDYVRTGQSLYTLGSTGRLWLIYNVYESDLAKVKKGQLVSFTTPALGEKELSARITYIDPLLNASTRTASVRAEIANTGNRLKPGMLIKGKIKTLPSTRAKSSTVSIPKSAVLWTGDKSVVYVKLEDSEVPSFQFREVTIGAQSGGQVSILEGLENGEEIVTNGAFSIDAAAQLNNNMSMMNRSVQIKTDANLDRLPDYVESTPSEFKQQLTALAKSYIPLKDAFVATDPGKAKEAATVLLAESNNVNMSLVKDDAHIYWMEQLNAITGHAEKITAEPEIEAQRKQFDFLSEALINSIKVFGIFENTFYVQYCPMAFNNQGADWISEETEIANPYFGDKMHKCGSVKDTIFFN